VYKARKGVGHLGLSRPTKSRFVSVIVFQGNGICFRAKSGLFFATYRGNALNTFSFGRVETFPEPFYPTCFIPLNATTTTGASPIREPVLTSRWENRWSPSVTQSAPVPNLGRDIYKRHITTLRWQDPYAHVRWPVWK
jgi:hypothetical protein